MDRPPAGATSRALVAGTLLSAGCFVLGVLLTLLGQGAGAQDPRRLDLVLEAAAQLRPWAWSTLGVICLLLTPPAGLLATVLETRRIQPATALLALAVLAILVLATGLAMLG